MADAWLMLRGPLYQQAIASASLNLTAHVVHTIDLEAVAHDFMGVFDGVLRFLGVSAEMVPDCLARLKPLDLSNAYAAHILACCHLTWIAHIAWS